VRGKLVLVFALGWSGAVFAQERVPVTVDSFTRAETDMYMGKP
jgi:hypothetical protein